MNNTESTKKDTLYIFSVFNDTYFQPQENVLNHKSTMRLLQDSGVPFKALIGSYKGIKESSLMIVGDAYFSFVQDLVTLFKQESYLVVEPYTRKATLVDVSSGNKMDVGVFSSAASHIALSQDNWTFDPSTQTYYICEA